MKEWKPATIIRWLNSEPGTAWSKLNHKRVSHHALLEDHEDLPNCHSPGAVFKAYDGEPYSEKDLCECLGGKTNIQLLGSDVWHCSPYLRPPADWWDIPYDPEVRF